MKINRQKKCISGLVGISSMNYGDVCRFEDKYTGSFFTLLKTSQRQVFIQKKEHIAQRMANTKKLLNLETAEIICVDCKQKVIRVIAEVYVEGDEP